MNCLRRIQACAGVFPDVPDVVPSLSGQSGAFLTEASRRCNSTIHVCELWQTPVTETHVQLTRQSIAKHGVKQSDSIYDPQAVAARKF